MTVWEDEIRFSLRVMINKHKTEVLFAEVDSDFADVLLSFLTLPLGKIVRLFEKHYGDEAAPVIGSLNTLYDGVANLASFHFWTESGKSMLLNPKSSFRDEYRKLKLSIDHNAGPAKYFTCKDWKCKWMRAANTSMDYDTLICYCGNLMNREIRLRESDTEGAADYHDENGLFLTNKMSFLISDDLRMVPDVTGSIIQTLESLGVCETDGAEQRTVIVGFNEIMDLLRRSLLSETPLTDFVFCKSHMASTMAVFEFCNLRHQVAEEDTLNSKKMIVKVMIQKSTNKLLFAQAEEDFVDFLFSLLSIPLGRVVSLLDGDTRLKSIDNFYRSIENINDKYFESLVTKNRLLKPELPPKYLSKNQILPVTEQCTLLYHSQDDEHHTEYLSTYKNHHSLQVQFKDPKGEGNCYVKGPRMFMVTDDLTVTPLCMLSSLSILSELKIALSDVKEVEVQIGLDEGLSLLKAALTSTYALTDGLMNNLILVKQPKEEL